MNIHRICIALGASERAQAQKGIGSLPISPAILGDAEPFTVGVIDPARRWVHVFDEHSTPVILNELSTISDFVEYLASKETLCASEHFMYAGSELDLLGYYLWHGRHFPIPAPKFRLDPHIWDKVVTNPQFLAGRRENEVSFFWDKLVEYFNTSYVNEILEMGNELPVTHYERAVRIMAGENRFYRRVLAKAILERAERAKGGYIGSLLPSSQPAVGYVLLIGPGNNGEDHSEYRKFRVAQLYCRCQAAKIAAPTIQYIVGLAFDAKEGKGSSEDLIFIDTTEWTDADFTRAKEIQEDLGYFISGKRIETRLNEVEYPDV